jgi:hypothetical protein
MNNATPDVSTSGPNYPSVLCPEEDGLFIPPYPPILGKNTSKNPNQNHVYALYN